jgi:hypothetical protein
MLRQTSFNDPDLAKLGLDTEPFRNLKALKGAIELADRQLAKCGYFHVRLAGT